MTAIVDFGGVIMENQMERTVENNMILAFWVSWPDKQSCAALCALRKAGSLLNFHHHQTKVLVKHAEGWACRAGAGWARKTRANTIPALYLGMFPPAFWDVVSRKSSLINHAPLANRSILRTISSDIFSPTTYLAIFLNDKS